MKIDDEISAHFKAFEGLDKTSISKSASLLGTIFKQGGKVLICGNGGSAGDSQHFSAELVGRFKTERKALPAIALSTDTSTLTAVGNDYGFERVFARQVEALGKAGDALVAISTSGNSQNVLEAIKAARKKSMAVVSLSGHKGGKMAELSDINVNIKSSDTARIQELHIFVIHCICGMLDELEW